MPTSGNGKTTNKNIGAGDASNFHEIDVNTSKDVPLTTFGEQTARLPDLTELENIQAELERIEEKGAGDASSSSQNLLGQNVAIATGSLGHTLLSNSNQKTILTGTKRSHSSSSLGQHNQVVTKVIISKNPSTNHPQSISSTVGQGSVRVVVGSTGLSQSHSGSSILNPHTGSLTPTKTVTISQGGIISPVKMSALPTTPTKQVIPANMKFPISPMKSPTKIAMIPVSGMRSPQKIAPAQFVTMVSRSSSSTATSTGRPATITMSPSKFIIKPSGNANRQNSTQGNKPAAAQALNFGNNVQPLSVAGSKFQYVRLVTTPAQSQHQNAPSKAPTPIQAKPIVPVTTVASSGHFGQNQMKITLPVQHGHQQVVAKPMGQSLQNQSSQRIILPATSQLRPSLGPQPIQPSGNPGPNSLSRLPPGTTIISSGLNQQGVQGFALVPAQYVAQLQQQMSQQNQRQESSNSSYVPITSSNINNSSSSARNNVNGSVLVTEPSGQRPRKPCNCTKSQCLKLYCDCFANGEFCHNCNCSNCSNNLDHEDERSRAIKACLDRNPLAFHPKIGKGKGKGEGDRRHNKGCNCKRSGCLKNYCECYEAKIMCSNLCKCVGCKNFEESPERKTLMHLADAAEVRVQQQTAAKSKLSSQELPSRPPLASSGERLPHSFVTAEVAEATCSCLMAQAEEAERTRQMEMMQERMILEEFGRCLMQVIDSANKTKGEL